MYQPSVLCKTREPLSISTGSLNVREIFTDLTPSVTDDSTTPFFAGLYESM